MPSNPARQIAHRISIGANGTVYVVGTSGFLRRYNATSDSFDLISGVTGVLNVGVAPDGFPWIISSPTTVSKSVP